MMKNDVSHADKLLKPIFLDFWKNQMLDPKKIQNPEIYFYNYIWMKRKIFYLSQIGQTML